MGLREDYLTRDDAVISDFASTVVGPGASPLAVAATTDHKVLELVDAVGQAGFSDAISALNKLLESGTTIFVVTGESLTLGFEAGRRLRRPEQVLTVGRGDVRVVGAGSGRLNTYLTLQVGPLVLQAFMGRWTPKTTRFHDLASIATALREPPSR